MRIEGRVAVVTGASRGIGAAVARELRRAGARLVLNARDEAALRGVASGEDALVPGDLTSDVTRQRLVAEALDRFGRVDLLVNNAGVGFYQNSIQADVDEIRALWELNFFVPLELSRLIVPHMLNQPRLTGAAEAGMVVNISSIAGKVTLPWFTMYSASKFALCSWTEGLRMEYGAKGIRTLLVCPGSVKTEFQSNVLSGAPPRSLSARRERFLITPEACARAVVKGIARNKRTVVVPVSAWLLVAAARLTPAILERYLARVNDTA
ncbi:MAG: SDR family NAD(P)-dependent oxidoreductase [Bryobacterales bacterium]|nr:SDR family NAD(P)-dependent oxidoreductase [Bryobacterales bacterium]